MQLHLNMWRRLSEGRVKEKGLGISWVYRTWTHKLDFTSLHRSTFTAEIVPTSEARSYRHDQAPDKLRQFLYFSCPSVTHNDADRGFVRRGTKDVWIYGHTFTLKFILRQRLPRREPKLIKERDDITPFQQQHYLLLKRFSIRITPFVMTIRTWEIRKYNAFSKMLIKSISQLLSLMKYLERGTT